SVRNTRPPRRAPDPGGPPPPPGNPTDRLRWVGPPPLPPAPGKPSARAPPRPSPPLPLAYSSQLAVPSADKAGSGAHYDVPVRSPRSRGNRGSQPKRLPVAPG